MTRLVRADSDSIVQSYVSRRSRRLHVAVVAVGWIVFALLWWRVLHRPGAPADVRMMGMVLGVLTMVVAVVTYLWIVHNVALAHRRDGRRSAGTLQRPAADLLGRQLDVAPEAATSSYVVVRVDGQGKHFLPGDRAHV